MLFDKDMMPRRLKNGASQIGGGCQSLRVSEVFASAYDVRALLHTTAALLDGRKLTDLHLPLEKKLAVKKLMKEM